MPLITRQGKQGKLTIAEMDGNLEYLKLEGTHYLFVLAKGTPEENAQEFIEAYAKAIDADKDEENRFTLVLSPGHYRFQETFEHSENYVNIVSRTGEQDVIFDLALEFEGADPVVLDPPAPPIVPFYYVTDLVIDQNDGDVIQSDTLQSGQPNWLGTLNQFSPEVIFNNNGLGIRGSVNNSFYPTYTLTSWLSSDITKVSCKFIHNSYTGDNYHEIVISLHDGNTGLPEFGNSREDQLVARVSNAGVLYINNFQYGGSTGISTPLVNGEVYTLELLSNPSASIQQARILDSTGFEVDLVSTVYVETAANYYRVSIGIVNEGPGYYPNILSTSSVMDISADYSLVSGIKTKEYTSNNYALWSLQEAGESDYYPLPLNIRIAGYDNLEVKNCTAGPFSFGSDWSSNNFENSSDLEVKVTNCTALAYSFGYGVDQIESGSVFTDCTGGNYCFYIWDDLRGTFTNCKAGDYSFQSDDDDVEGTFTNCEAGDYSFYSDDDNITGTFINCKGGYRCFYADNDISAEFTNCVAGDDSFEGDSEILSDSIFTNCTAGYNSFIADDGNNDGTYINCTAGNDSFRAYESNNGTFRDCTAGIQSFRTSNSSINATFTNCVADSGSFDADGSNNGNYYYCVLKNDTFDGGNRYYCVDDNY